MNTMIETIFSISPILMFFLLGSFLKKMDFLKEGSSADIKKIVSAIALPALLFQAFASMKMESRYILLFILIFAVCGFMIIIAQIISRISGVKTPYFAFMMGGFEMGMLGYALFLSIHGSEQLSKFALMDLGQVIFVFFVLMALLIKEKEGTNSFVSLMTSFLKSPVILAIFAGLITGFLKTRVNENGLTRVIHEFLVLTGNLTVPLIALMIGYELSFKKEGIIPALKTIIFRKVLLIILGLLINRFFIRSYLGLDRIYELALMTMFLLPPPFVISIYMTQEDRKNLDYVNNTLSISTVVSVILITFMTALYP